MKYTHQKKLFTEITTEEAANINGGFFLQPVTNWINEQISKAKKAAEDAKKLADWIYRGNKHWR